MNIEERKNYLSLLGVWYKNNKEISPESYITNIPNIIRDVETCLLKLSEDNKLTRDQIRENIHLELMEQRDLNFLSFAFKDPADTIEILYKLSPLTNEEINKGRKIIEHVENYLPLSEYNSMEIIKIALEDVGLGDYLRSLRVAGYAYSFVVKTLILEGESKWGKEKLLEKGIIHKIGREVLIYESAQNAITFYNYDFNPVNEDDIRGMLAHVKEDEGIKLLYRVIKESNNKTWTKQIKPIQIFYIMSKEKESEEARAILNYIMENNREFFEERENTDEIIEMFIEKRRGITPLSILKSKGLINIREYRFLDGENLMDKALRRNDDILERYLRREGMGQSSQQSGMSTILREFQKAIERGDKNKVASMLNENKNRLNHMEALVKVISNKDTKEELKKEMIEIIIKDAKDSQIYINWNRLINCGEKDSREIKNYIIKQKKEYIK